MRWSCSTTTRDVNVQEEVLRKKIDPYLTVDSLSELAGGSVGRPTAAGKTKLLTGGCWNRVISVETDSPDYPELVFKISPDASNDRLVREYSVLEYFRKNTSMPVPEPLLIDTSGEIIPGSVFVMSKIPGVVMHHCLHRFGVSERRAVSRQIAEYVRDLHAKTDSGFGGVELTGDKRSADWAGFWLPRFDAAISEIAASDRVPVDLVDQSRDLRTYFESGLDLGGTATLTHYDIWSGNVMIETSGDGPRVSGFIDIPGFFADYAREISFMMMFGVADQSFFEIYSARHSIDPGFELRVNMYNLKMHLKHITMYPEESYYREGARRCIEHLRANLT